VVHESSHIVQFMNGIVLITCIIGKIWQRITYFYSIGFII